MNRYIRSFLRGAASLYFPEDAPLSSKYPKYRTAAEALRADWERVGQDIRKAMDAYEEEIKGLEEEELSTRD